MPTLRPDPINDLSTGYRLAKVERGTPLTME
jgi:hypothetical protein